MSEIYTTETIIETQLPFYSLLSEETKEKSKIRESAKLQTLIHHAESIFRIIATYEDCEGNPYSREDMQALGNIGAGICYTIGNDFQRFEKKK